MDAARWLRPEQIADLSELSARVILKLLYHHLPLRAMAWYRLASAARRLGIRGVPACIQRRLATRFGLEMVPGDPVGGGLYIAHAVGCTLVARQIGSNVSVIASATFGVRNDEWPVVEDGVYVGAGARVLGGITVGAGARVGANAVVLHDVEPGATVVGIPAQPVRRRANLC